MVILMSNEMIVCKVYSYCGVRLALEGVYSANRVKNIEYAESFSTL